MHSLMYIHQTLFMKILDFLQFLSIFLAFEDRFFGVAHDFAFDIGSGAWAQSEFIRKIS